ncbi:oxidoreductase [Sporanaerobium hydrogeniformans]|uniref:Oxidoreductase n=1 Tax=Sporanaerobium hydrogeniformans TaxID=3072179 RepID=A0AC61D954_9FIRM|nr:Gfo/Idh/MocA family oxidoreductase [Sporanaerobium hydrogeniformans]PHV69253.1 oxidoreductase [Sporanaerobium hydrogeniformans]
MKIGILGAGKIAKVMAATLNQMEEATCYAVAARDLERAEAFAKSYQCEKAYGSYEELVKDEEVELIYIATPHSHHYEHAKLCIEHGKAVLCEKAFTRNAKEARELLALAKEKGVFITEAIWTRYMPSRKLISELIKSDIIGKPALLTANLGYNIAEKERIIRPELAGGALLDLGIYPINFALMVFGNEIEKITSTATLSDTGVDLQNSITFTYKTGEMAVLNSTALALSDRKGIIYGDKGFIIIENINNCEKVCVFNMEREMIKCVEVPEQISGYEYQVIDAIAAIKAGQLECEAMPHAETIRVMEMMDYLRKEWGVIYPGE